MGELPVSDHARPGIARWVIPLTLAAIVTAAGLYEWLRPAAESRSGNVRGPGTAGDRAAPPAPAASTPSAASDAGPAAALPPTSPPSAPPAAVTSPAVPAPVVQPPATPAPAAPAGQSAPTGQATPLPNPLVASAPAASEPAPSVTIEPEASGTSAGAAATATDAPKLVLAFRDYSWTEVKDRNGRVLLFRMNSGGTTQSLAGAPPLDLVIGNAADVSVTYRGKPVDLAPHTRQNVARLTLP
jgi:cytoskeleton protein RodZ